MSNHLLGIIESKYAVQECKTFVEDMDHLKPNILQVLVARMDRLEKTVKYLEEKDFQLQLRVLIEQGRNHFWNKYESRYRNDFPAFVRQSEYYDRSIRSEITFFRPKYWNHFFQIVHDLYEPSIGPFLEELEGSMNSTYADLSAGEHSFDKKRVAEMLQTCNDEAYAYKYGCLFEIVCGKSVEEFLLEE